MEKYYAIYTDCTRRARSNRTGRRGSRPPCPRHDVTRNVQPGCRNRKILSKPAGPRTPRHATRTYGPYLHAKDPPRALTMRVPSDANVAENARPIIVSAVCTKIDASSRYEAAASVSSVRTPRPREKQREDGNRSRR